MTADTLAILGGSPHRKTPFLVEPMVDEAEEQAVLEAVRERNFSRYIGTAVGDDVLRLTSAQAAEISDYWHFLGGKNVRLFAAEFAQAMGVAYAIPINSATTGLSVALAAAGVGPGDEVIVPAISFSATGNAPLMYGSIPVFVDVDPETFCLDPAKVEAAITPRTKALLPVHLAGNVAAMDRLMAIAEKHSLVVIEDACQAIGAGWNDRKVGGIGHAGVFSFQQSKNIMTGEGGMIVTNSSEIAKRSRLILNHGEAVFGDGATEDDLANIVGYNFRMPELCAALGRTQLRKLERVNEWRTRNADLLRELLDGVHGLTVAPSQRRQGGPATEVPHFLTALYDEAAMGLPRALFVAALREEGIPVGTGYVRPMYMAPLFLKKVAQGAEHWPWSHGGRNSTVSYAKGQCPVAEALLERRFLWFYHIAYSSTAKDMEDIAGAVRKVVDNRALLIERQAELSDKLGGHSAGRIGVAPQQMRKG